MSEATKPSEFIRRHLAGAVYDLDDLVSWFDRDPAYQDVLQRIHAINYEFTLPGEPPLGVYKPEAREALMRLAEQLESKGR